MQYMLCMGRRFKDATLTKFFSLQKWYKPTKDDVSQNELNSFEKANVELIRSKE